MSSVATDTMAVGSKAARLHQLEAAGFPVPPMVVLPAATLNGWQAGAPAPDQVATAIEEAIASLPPGPLAVRSSADAEDGGAASFAGQYETVLGVEGVADVTAAVRTCLDSADAPRVDAYRGAGTIRMSVLLQPLLAPSAAGVAFTADPVTGDTNLVHVSAVAGLGDVLVDGTATPDEWRVTDAGAELLHDGGHVVLRADEAAAVAKVAVEVAAHFDEPQDVEWALVDGEVIVLQARPITALPTPPTNTLEGLGWEKDLGHYPQLVTPFGWSVYETCMGPATVAMGNDFGLMLADLEQVSIGGEIYVRPVPPFGSPEPQGSVPPAPLIGLVARLHPELRRRMRTAKRVLTSGTPERLLERWRSEWRAEFEERIDELLAVELSGLDDATFIDHHERAGALLAHGHWVHFQVFVPYILALHDLVTACQELVGWDELRVMNLLIGSSPASIAGAEALASLQDEVARRPELRAALSAAPADPVAALRRVDEATAEELAAWIRRHAWRTTNYDPGSASIAERPGIVTRLLLEPPGRSDADPAGAAEAEIEEALAGRPGELERFRRVLAAARAAYPIREENVVLTDNIPSGIFRRWMLEAGRRLVERGRLARVEDAAFCQAAELLAALGGDESVDLPAAAARRRGEQAWVRAHPGPVLVGEPDDMPDLRWLPKYGRKMNEAVLWMLRMEFPAEVVDTQVGDVVGTPASPGTCTGRVRVVRSEADFAGFLPGEVLVCPITTPSWTILFAAASAVVTDGGGTLSHSAIVAREHGIPAVVGTGEATSTFRDGELVTVDGTAGTVVRIEE